MKARWKNSFRENRGGARAGEKGMIGVLVVGTAALLSLSFSNVPLAAAGIGDWSDMPTITLRLPGKVDSSWKEVCSGKTTPWKASDKSGVRCDNARYVTLTVPDMEKYYGDVGPGLALGYRACQIAYSRLYPGVIPTRGDLFVVSGLSACPADPISFITGVRYGKDSRGVFNGNLVFDDKIELFSYVFVSMSSGKAFKLTCRYRLPKEFLDLQEQKRHDPSAVEKFWTMAHCLSRYIFTAPESEIYEVTPLEGFPWKKYVQETAG